MLTNLFLKVWHLTAIVAVFGLGCTKQKSVTNNEKTATTASGSTAASTGTLTVPSKPASIPASIKHLIFSDDYRVEVKLTGTSTYQEVPVYKTDNYVPAVANSSDRRPETAASFANFSFTSGTSVDVRITAIQTPISSYKIRPINYQIASSQPNNWQVTYTINTNRKISVDINGRLDPLFIFGNPPEAPQENASGGTTYTYAPETITDIGYQKPIHSHDRINIRAGAIVQGTFLLDKLATDIKFIGQGIITSGNVAFGPNPNTQVVKNSTFAGVGDFYNGVSNVTWDGLNIVNAAGWVFACVQGFSATTHLSHNNIFKDLKEVNWNPQTDVMWFDGDYNTVSDCFFFANDDITTHGSYHCMLSNIVLWEGGNGGHLFMHYNYSNSDDIVYDNIEIIGVDNVMEVIKIWAGSATNVSVNNLTFKNINIEERSAPSSYWKNRFIKMYPATNGSYTASNWTFSNIKIATQQPSVSTNDNEGILDPSAAVSGLTFTSFYYGNTKMTSLNQARITKNANVSAPVFQ